MLKRTGLILPTSASIPQLFSTVASYFGIEAPTHKATPIFHDQAKSLQVNIPWSFNWKDVNPDCIHSVRD